MNCLEEIPFCDSFNPTWTEFKDFSGYLEKIIPPKGWKARKDNYRGFEFNVPHPIEQIVTGKDGLYELILLQRESRSLSKYQKLVGSFDKITENKKPEEVEKLFWRTLKFNSPLYGADAPGSLFDKGTPWNLSEIDSLLKKGLNDDIVGVTTPYLYFGSWKAMFAWHKEDLDLLSINYLHFGKPKCWYGLRQEDEKKFQQFASKYFAEAASECPEFLRHKTHLIHPNILKQNGFEVNRCIQNPGEFVVTKCAAYHAGFNMGFNCAEAVNFALKSWVSYGKAAGYCKCQTDTVKIDMDTFNYNVNLEKSDSTECHKRSCIVKPLKEEKTKSIYDRDSKYLNKKRNSTNSTDMTNTTDMTDTFEIYTEVIEDWLCCDSCNKWRKIPGDTNYSKLKSSKKFICSMMKGLSCKNPEEKWKKNYTTIKTKICEVETCK